MRQPREIIEFLMWERGELGKKKTLLWEDIGKNYSREIREGRVPYKALIQYAEKRGLSLDSVFKDNNPAFNNAMRKRFLKR